ncbi:MAG: sugar phosphate isomerase/epimerase [Deltaproteobacteria bacterium]|nr:sugar phosphate isomerase/epimerase [Deltaproteobacteria bacterium]
MGDSFSKLSRREFIALSGTVIGSISAACAKKEPEGQAEKPAAAVQPEFPQDIPYAGFRVGVQSYCFREFKTQDKLIESIHELGLAHIELWPEGHMPIDTPDDQLKAAVARFKNEGITIDACGVVGIENDEAEARKIFEYAKKLGVIAISAAPTHEALPLMARLTEEYALPIAIHNHGPQDKLYGTSELVRTHLSQLPAAVGLCLDTGHVQRAGEDPMAWLDEFGDRVQGVHLKDMVPDESGRYHDAIVGRGALDLPLLMKKLKALGFKGYFSLEYESEPGNPLPAMKECLAELRKACAGLA